MSVSKSIQKRFDDFFRFGFIMRLKKASFGLRRQLLKVKSATINRPLKVSVLSGHLSLQLSEIFQPNTGLKILTICNAASRQYQQDENSGKY